MFKYYRYKVIEDGLTFNGEIEAENIEEADKEIRSIYAEEWGMFEEDINIVSIKELN